ncbi:MAG: TetR/AcrR family transcriptional regulator [Leptolyngbya sp.]|nr:TetR/AcrR family transcriptional regulator [Candidatus Melainabacteria bacterium]
MNSRRDKKKTERKHQILDAASSLFKEKGYDQTSVDDIAKQADIARGTVFYNFESKEEIVFALRFRSVDEAKARALAQLSAGVPALKCIEAFIIEVAQWTEKNPQLAEVLWRIGPIGFKRFLKTEDLNLSEKLESCQPIEGGKTPGPPNLIPHELILAAQKEKTMRADFPPERISHHLNFILIHGQMEWLKGSRTQPLDSYMLDELKLIREGIG